MTRRDTYRIIALVSHVWPEIFRRHSPELVRVWSYALEDENAAEVFQAVRYLAENHRSKYPPSLGDILATRFQLANGSPRNEWQRKQPDLKPIGAARLSAGTTLRELNQAQLRQASAPLPMIRRRSESK